MGREDPNREYLLIVADAIGDLCTKLCSSAEVWQVYCSLMRLPTVSVLPRTSMPSLRLQP